MRAFRAYLADRTRCPGIEDARKITNGTKHFGPSKIPTGSHHGDFDRADFSDDFDVSYLWIDRNGTRIRAEDFIEELVKFWDAFFAQTDFSWTIDRLAKNFSENFCLSAPPHFSRPLRRRSGGRNYDPLFKYD